MLDAGVPILEALPKAADTVKNAVLGKRFQDASNSIQAGCNLTEALKKIKEFNRSAIQVIASGEQSGKLAETLLHFSELEAEAINLQEEMLAEWIPRLIYIAITAWMGYSIIASYLDYFFTLDQTLSTLR